MTEPPCHCFGACALESELSTKRGHRNEKLAHCSEEQPHPPQPEKSPLGKEGPAQLKVSK